MIALGFASTLVLAACGNNDETVDTTAGSNADTTAETSNEATGSESNDFSIVMVTDVGGVDDKSFNQSAWEGMEEWGEENGKEKGAEGFNYIQSEDESQFVTNLNTALQNNFDLIYGIGFALQPAMEDVASQNPDQHFVMIDEVIEADNVASVLFKDHEAAFLAGVAAAETTETGKVGFIGGIESEVISRFEAGFRAGVEAADPDVEVVKQYAASFEDASKGKSISAAMFTDGADVIYHAAGAVGNGVFSEAIDRMNAGSDKDLWVIGVDRDQEAEGKYDGGNLTLTSTIKGVGKAVKDISNDAMNGTFPGGETTNFGLKEEAVDLSRGNLSDEAWEKVEEFKEKIISGEIEVPTDPKDL